MGHGSTLLLFNWAFSHAAAGTGPAFELSAASGLSRTGSTQKITHESSRGLPLPYTSGQQREDPTSHGISKAAGRTDTLNPQGIGNRESFMHARALRCSVLA